eukprot:s416_g13.t1
MLSLRLIFAIEPVRARQVLFAAASCRQIRAGFCPSGMTLAVLLPGALVRFELGAELLLSSALAHAPKRSGTVSTRLPRRHGKDCLTLPWDEGPEGKMSGQFSVCSGSREGRRELVSSNLIRDSHSQRLQFSACPSCQGASARN